MALSGSCVLTLHRRAHDVEIIVDCTGMTEVAVYRFGSRGPEPVRLMDHVEVVTPDRFIGVDAEVPNGTVKYIAYATDGTDTLKSLVKAVVMNHGGDWLMPLGMLRDGRLVNVESLKEQSYATDREVVSVLGRPDPIAVHYGRHWFSGSLVLLTLEDQDRIAMEQMLYEARIIVFCPRAVAGYSEPLYLSIGEVKAERTSPRVQEKSRRWTMDIQSVGAPPADWDVAPVGTSWQTVEDAGLTWGEQQLINTWRTLMGI